MRWGVHCVHKPEDVTLCLTDPGDEINLLVTADLATFFKLWLGCISYKDALRECDVAVEGNYASCAPFRSGSPGVQPRPSSRGCAREPRDSETHLLDAIEQMV